MQTRSGIQKDLITETYREYPTDEEESRIVAGKSLIRYLVNGKIEILYANGNFSVYDPETDLWTITNNFGKRRCKRHSNGDTFDIEPIPAAVETCAETYAQVLFKEDNVISILYPNGTRYTIHHDGTQIITNGDESEIVFEKLGFSQVRVLSGRMIEEPEKIKDMNKSDADLEFYESLQTSRIFLKDRIMNGQIIQTYLHDKTVIQSFVEVSEFGQTKDGEPNIDLNDEAEGTNQEVIEGQDAEGPYCQAVHLIRRQDMSVTKVTQDGEACLISGPARMELNKNGEICRLGRDYDYLYQMFSTRPEERKGGVFTCMLSKSNITTHDKERNFFAVNSNGTFEKVLAPEISEVDHFNDAPDQIPDDELMEMEGEHATIMSKESKNNTGTIPKVDIEKSKIRQEDQLHDVNKLPVPPRVFFIRSDGSGSEFYTKDRMQDETGRFSHDVIIVKSTEVIGQNPVFMHSYFIPLKTGEINDEEYSVVADIQKMKIKDSKNKDAISIPKNVEEYKQVFRTLIDRPKSKMYLYINYMQHKDFAQFKRNAFNDDLARYKKWKEDSDGSVNKRFGLFEPNEDMKDRSIDKRIVTKIYRERQTERPEFDQNKIKEM